MGSMGLKVYTTQSVTALTGAEISLLEDAARACGRATLLVPSFAERDVCRRALADARVGTGVDVTTPEAWIEGLWELFGDGRRVVSPLERRMLVSALMGRRDAGQIAPLRDNPGTARLISQIAEALLPEIAAPSVLGRGEVEPGGESERVVFCLVRAYADMLAARGLVEASEAASILAGLVGDSAPACARFVAVRDVPRLPGHVMRLLRAVAGAGEVALLLNPDQRSLASELDASVETVGLDDGRPASRFQGDPEFLEVAGPHARGAA